ncbi:hypothetical protein VTN00DRAFT_3002 [Thermoascus crustaceus]|uniref:uncharacterized protein n=1 Tax=Thermoascus crustaceus TaxID=5088 RepID=UPI003744A913
MSPSSSSSSSSSHWSPEAIPRKENGNNIWIFLLSIRFITVVFSAAGIICFALALKQHERVYTDGIGEAMTGSVLGTVSYAFLSSLLVVFTTQILNIAVHPGIRIPLDLIACAAVLTTSIMDLHEVAYYHAEHGYRYSCKWVYGVPCRGLSDRLLGVEYFGCAVGVVDGIFHAILFIWACRDYHIQRKQNRKKGSNLRSSRPQLPRKSSTYEFEDVDLDLKA